MRSQGIEVINLGIGSPDLPPPLPVRTRLGEDSVREDTHAYQPYQGIPELRTAFADWYQRHYRVLLDPQKEVYPLIGSKEGLVHLAFTFLESGDQALVPNPGYPTYRTATELAGASPLPYDLLPENKWLPDFETLEKKDLRKVKIMWVNYPHMPTGAQADTTFFDQLVAFARKHRILIVHDNPYSFILNDTPLSILSATGAMDVAVELNSLSKSHNMAGWRIGMLAGRADYLAAVIRFKSNMDSGMFKPLQYAAALALQAGPDWYAALNETYRGRREKVYALLEKLDCSWDPQAAGMFVWAAIPSHWKDGIELTDALLEKTAVFITPGSIFGSQGKSYVRISLCNPTSVLEDAIQRIENHFH
jgi:aspartate/methionine/tyrosine aminotransferase